MPTYTGSFPLVAQGQAVTVKLDGVSLTDPDPGNVGSAVRNGQLVYSYEYDAGDDDTTLVATVQTSAGQLTAYLELDLAASIAAGGGGVVLDGTPIVIELNAGQALDPGASQQAIVFDTFGTGSAAVPDTDLGAWGVAAGAYIADLELDFDNPDARWSVSTSVVSSTASGSGFQGPSIIQHGDHYTAYSLMRQSTILLPEGAHGVVRVRVTPDPDAVTPTALNIGYAALTLTPTA